MGATNASTSIKVYGSATAAASVFALSGANGGFLSADHDRRGGGGTFQIDNNLAIGASGAPRQTSRRRRMTIASAIARRSDCATAVSAYVGRSATAASETFGGLECADRLRRDDSHHQWQRQRHAERGRSHLGGRHRHLARGFGRTWSRLGRLFNGTIPTADATGVLPRVVGTSDFLPTTARPA